MSQMATWSSLNPIGARLGKTAAVAVTTGSVVKDLQSLTNIWTALTKGQLVMVQTQADVYYAFNSENGGTIDQTAADATNPSQQCALIPAGACLPFRPPYVSQTEINQSGGALTNLGMCRYLLVRGDAASTMRLYIASEKPSDRVGI